MHPDIKTYVSTTVIQMASYWCKDKQPEEAKESLETTRQVWIIYDRDGTYTLVNIEIQKVLYPTLYQTHTHTHNLSSR